MMYPAAAAPENEGWEDHLNFMELGLLSGEIRVMACSAMLLS